MKYAGFTGSVLLLVALLVFSIKIYQDYKDINFIVDENERRERAGVIRAVGVLYAIFLYAVCNMVLWFWDTL